VSKLLKSKIVALGLVAVMSLGVLSGCSKPAEEAAAAPTPEETATAVPAEPVEEAPALEGAVIIDGSGTVYPLMANIAEDYMVKLVAQVRRQALKNSFQVKRISLMHQERLRIRKLHN